MTLPKHPEPLTLPKHKPDTGPLHQHTNDNGLLFIFPGTPIGVRKALSSVLGGLRFLNLSTEESGTVELVLAEVMNNIVEHAYAGNPDGRIELHITPTDRGLLCKVRDDGHPMPDKDVPIGNGTLPDCEIKDLPEGGFGWFLIRDLARDIEYNRSDKKNQLSFRISVGLSEFQIN
ncbi:MAG: ATP-binding protein [Marinosulfonomonas sp.]|nr:ATP-binding protein [Marinosulfonomonas sp.]